MKIEIDTHFLRTVIVGERVVIFNIFLWIIFLVILIITYVANTAVMIMKGYNQWYDYCINIFMLISIIFNIRVIYRRLTLSKTTKLLLEQYIRNAEDMALQKHE